MRDSLMDHFRFNNLLSDKQIGFLKGRSTNIQMIRVMDDWSKHLDHGMSVDVVYLDFMKAFDKVSHEHLIHKLQYLGIHHSILNWIEDFLNDRSQMVKYNNCVSSSVEVVCGVPQGSVIGPTSFILFINDLPDVVPSKLYMFADVTKMYNGMDTVSDRQQLQSDIDNLVAWSTTWHLLFNPLKCKVMTLGRASGTSDCNYTMSL